LTRYDHTHANSTLFRPELYAKFKSYASPSGHISKQALAKYRKSRESETPGLKPSQRPQGFVESALLFKLLSDETGDIRVDWLDVLYQQERFPFELGFKLRPVVFLEAVALSKELQSLADAK
jgi:hypothetical protein